MNKNITRSTLIDSLVFGKKINLLFYVPAHNQYARMAVRVTGLTLESGSAEGVAARHYNVTCATNGGTLKTYVYTID